MFEQDTERTFIEARPEEVLDIYTSINRSTVAVPDRAPEPSQAFIASVYKGNLYHAYIYLWLATSNSGLIYRWSEGGVRGDVLNSVYQAAFEFTESMGFMLDNLHYRDKGQEDKAQLFAEVPMFHSDLSFMREKEPEEKVEELVIEPLVEGSEVETVAEEADEINLDALGDDEVATVELAEAPASDEEIRLGGREVTLEPAAEIQPVPLAGADDAAVESEVTVEEDVALDSLEVEGPEAAPAAAEPSVEDSLLDSLETGDGSAVPEPEALKAEEEEEVEISIEPPADEETQEAPPMVDAVLDRRAGREEAALTPEEEQVLGGAEQEEAAAEEGAEAEEGAGEEPPEPPPEPRKRPGKAPAPRVTPPAAEEAEETESGLAEAPPAVEVPPPPSPTPPRAVPPPVSAPARPTAFIPAGGEITEEDHDLLARLLAMM
jgi:hypothetical protein